MSNRSRRLLMVIGALLLTGGLATLVVRSGGHAVANPAETSFQQAAAATCHAAIDETSDGVQPGYRVVFSGVAVPPAYVGPMAPIWSGPWRYWQETGFQIRGDSPAVTISVPEGWRDRAAITWGAYGIVSVLRMSSCPPRGMWNDYAAAFFLRSRSACVPLQLRAGPRAATAWFGLGRRCGGTGRADGRSGAPR